jgi:hypothetical protein
MAERPRKPAPGEVTEPAPLDERLWFLGNLDALRQRLVLAEVLGQPVSRRPRGRRARGWRR